MVYRTLTGQIASETRIVGYCRLHKCYLTLTQMRNKQCLQKNCFRLMKHDNPFWEQRERKKELRQLKKEQGISPWEKVEIRTDRNGDLLPKLKKK